MRKSDRAAPEKAGNAKDTEDGAGRIRVVEAESVKRRRRAEKLNSRMHGSETAKGQTGKKRPGIIGKYPEKNKNPARIDYMRYRLSVKEWLKYAVFYIALDASVSYLFFSSAAAFLILLPGMILFLLEQKKTLQEKRKREITGQFLDGIQLMLAALQAGYSSENALHEARKELRKIYEEDAMIVREFDFMDAQIGMSRNLEELFLDFARRSGAEDLVSFAEVLLTAKRTGGDLISIIRNTVSCIRQKRETMQEIETCIAGKVMEQNIMSVVPVLILAYIRLSSPDFLESMYHTEAGVLVMTICFIVYVLAYLWGKRIMRIEV